MKRKQISVEVSDIDTVFSEGVLFGLPVSIVVSVRLLIGKLIRRSWRIPDRKNRFGNSVEIRKNLLLSLWSVFLEPKRWEKAFNGFLLALILIQFSACMTVRRDSSQVPVGTQVQFIVANSDTNLPIGGVRLILVSRQEPIREVVTTNENGRASVSKAVLATPGVEVLLFCAEDFFCGALRLREDALLDFDERLIQLAPFAIY